VSRQTTFRLIQHFGKWPSFDDAEVVSLSLNRSPWQNGVAKDIRATFYMFELTSGLPTKECHVEVLFKDVADVLIEGFNHQNPILGLGLWLAPVEHLRGERLFVRWGGTCMNHDVAFHCRSLSVMNLTVLKPFKDDCVA